MSLNNFDLVPGKVIDIEKYGVAGAMAVMSEWRKFLIAVSALGLIVGILLVVLETPKYSAISSFVSASQLSGSGRGSSLAALNSAASSFGLDLAESGNDLSNLFPWILESRQLGQRILLAPVMDKFGNEVHLLDILVPADLDSVALLNEGLRILHSEVMMHRFDHQSRVTTLTVRLNDPEVATQITNLAVQYLDEFNIRERRAHARQQVKFLEHRLTQIEEDVSVAEVALRDFRVANRRLAGSPQLLLEESRLIRNQELSQQLYLNLKTKLEIVRLEENKDFPIIAVIDPAWLPTESFSPGLVRLSIVGLVLGLMIGLFVAFAINQVRLVQAQARQKGLTGPQIS